MHETIKSSIRQDIMCLATKISFITSMGTILGATAGIATALASVGMISEADDSFFIAFARSLLYGVGGTFIGATAACIGSTYIYSQYIENKYTKCINEEHGKAAKAVINNTMMVCVLISAIGLIGVTTLGRREQIALVAVGTTFLPKISNFINRPLDQVADVEPLPPEWLANLQAEENESFVNMVGSYVGSLISR